MSSKKKDDDEFEITFDADKRKSYRLTPPSYAPVIVYFGSEACHVSDISAGGLSFQAPSGVSEGKVIPIRFRLPYIDAVVQAKFKVLAIEEGEVRGPFVDLSQAGTNDIHRYVLEVQKEIARRSRERRKRRP